MGIDRRAGGNPGTKDRGTDHLRDPGMPAIGAHDEVGPHWNPPLARSQHHASGPAGGVFQEFID